MAAHYDTRWYLNDIVINDYMNLIVEHDPSVYAYDTFFYNRLINTGYIGVKQWTKKLNIFSKSKLLIPININKIGIGHWALVCVYFPKKQIYYYDSINTNDLYDCTNQILTYLSNEHSHILGKPLTIEEWGVQMPGNPKQNKEIDCGVFICMFAKYLSRGAEFNFTQAHMWSFRQLIVRELIIKRLIPIDVETSNIDRYIQSIINNN